MPIQVSGSTGVSTNALPFIVGQVSFFAMSSAPAGFLKCSGQAVSRTTYAALFTAIGTLYGAGDGSTTFNLPDLRGEFLRGLDDGRGVDVDRVLGASQNDALQNIVGSLPGGRTGQGAATGPFAKISEATNGVAGSSATHGYYEFDASRTARTAAETRPRNVALLACIFTGVNQ